MRIIQTHAAVTYGGGGYARVCEGDDGEGEGERDERTLSKIVGNKRKRGRKKRRF